MSDISRWDLRSGRVGDNNEVFFMDRSKDGPWVSYGDAVFALDAKDALLREAREALKLAQTIIGHPDDAGSQHIASVISKLEAQK